jgi:hypothetical protein
VYARKISESQYVHTAAEFLIDAQGNIRKVYGADMSVPDTEKDIESLLRTEGLYSDRATASDVNEGIIDEGIRHLS